MAGIPCGPHGLDMIVQPALQSAKVDRVLLVAWALRRRPRLLALCRVRRRSLAMRVPSSDVGSTGIRGVFVVDVPQVHMAACGGDVLEVGRTGNDNVGGSGAGWGDL